jgi:hypothetical protein
MAFSYYICLIDYGRKGLEAVVQPEKTKQNIVDECREAIGRGHRIEHVKFFDGESLEDVTSEMLADAEREADLAHIRACLNSAQGNAWDQKRKLLQMGGV